MSTKLYYWKSDLKTLIPEWAIPMIKVYATPEGRLLTVRYWWEFAETKGRENYYKFQCKFKFYKDDEDPKKPEIKLYFVNTRFFKNSQTHRT